MREVGASNGPALEMIASFFCPKSVCNSLTPGCKANARPSVVVGLIGNKLARGKATAVRAAA